ncbi:MAG: C45 family autoproteolytic acyltransferase/hydrolase [Pseudomonadota bacterium]
MGEIRVASRRVSRPRRIARRLGISLCLLILVTLVTTFGFWRATSYHVPGGTLSSESPESPESLESFSGRDSLLAFDASTMHQQGNIWVLKLSGEPHNIGFAHARLLGRMATEDESLLEESIVGEHRPSSLGWLARLERRARLRWRFRLLAAGMPAPRLVELAGYARGLARACRAKHGPASIPDLYERLVWRQAALDVGSVGGSQAPFGGLASGLAFVLGGGAGGSRGSGSGSGGSSSSGSSSGSGGSAAGLANEHPIMGRSFSLPGTDGAEEIVAVIVALKGRIPFLSIGWPGFVGVVTGVNAEGIAVAVNPSIADDIRPTASARPVALVGREILESATTLDEAIAIARSAPMLGAASLLIVSGTERQWVVVERSPGKAFVSRPGELRVAGDYLQSATFAKDAENNRAKLLRPGAGRISRLARLVGAASMSSSPAAAARPPSSSSAQLEAAVAILRDSTSQEGTPLPLGNSNAVNDLTAAHAVVIDPATRRAWISEGPGASGRSWQMVGLCAVLAQGQDDAQCTIQSGETSGELTADNRGIDLDAARRLILARRYMRQGERARRLGEPAVAAEAAARAVALAPQLAEAHRLVGDVARDRGDRERAKASYRRYLELYPASQMAADEARFFVESF